MNRTLDNPFYYLENFQTVIEWTSERYSNLLSTEEQAFISRFPTLPQASRALLVRMVMRKGELFRASKLQYAEIGCPRAAALPLVEHGWIDARPLLSLDQVFALLTRPEIAQAFRPQLPKTSTRKAEQLEALRTHFPELRHFDTWHPASSDCIYQLLIDPLAERIKLMFFGNCYQDWSEFVLADLGIYQYEKVELPPSSQAFQSRADVYMYLHLQRCRERFEQGEAAADILDAIPAYIPDNDWLERRRGKLLFQLAQELERKGNLQHALAIYRDCTAPGARIRTIRVLERCGEYEAAFALAQSAAQMPESETEQQHLLRILPRLHRKLGLPKIAPRPAASITSIELVLPYPQEDFYVEDLVARHFAQDDAPVCYVENTLITSLFGLLCWKAIFAAVPGAFFHPFHTGPADLHSADFHQRREQEFKGCLSQLDSTQYLDTINRNFIEKAGIQSPFVVWQMLTEELKDLALHCIPAAHLKKWFERMLLDIKSNRAGFPDLIQFWPDERRYRMIEVKGPGDRLQDNQIRWLDFCAEHDMPVSVCYVQWAEQ
jgi:tetratricopeptide (TPR) repeat protein